MDLINWNRHIEAKHKSEWNTRPHNSLVSLMELTLTVVNHLCFLSLDIRGNNLFSIRINEKYPIPNDLLMQWKSITNYYEPTVWNERIRICATLQTFKGVLSFKAPMILIYFALFYINITHCNTIWGAANKALRPLEALQKRAVRIIDSLRRREHTNGSFCKYNLIKLHDINIFSCSIFMFRCLNGLAIILFFLK